MEAGRTVFLNVPEDIRMIFYVLAGITVLIFFYGIWSRITFWSKGEDEDSEALAGLGRGAMLRMVFTDFFSADCFLAKRVFQRSKVRGILLVFIVWSFVILFLGTVTVTADYDFNLGFLKGGRYLAFSLIMDLAGLTLLLGTGAALLRRYVIKPERMLTYMEDGTILALLFLTVFFGFATEGLRMAVTQPPGLDGSPVGAAFAAIFNAAVSGSSLIQLHLYAWVMHFVFAFGFIAYIPYSKQFHMFAAQITTNAAAERRAMNKKEVGS